MKTQQKLATCASLVTLLSSIGFALCDGGNNICPPGQSTTWTGTWLSWSCCDQEKRCVPNGPIGVTFTRTAKKNKYTVGSTTYYCVTRSEYQDSYGTPCVSCPD